MAFVNSGMSVRRVAFDWGYDRKTVRRWRDRHNETGDVIRKEGSGKTRKVTAQDVDNFRSAVAAKPITTAQEIIGN